jgi:hypothetical protein
MRTFRKVYLLDNQKIIKALKHAEKQFPKKERLEE